MLIALLEAILLIKNHFTKENPMNKEELQNVPQMISTKIATQQQLIQLLYSQVVDLTMMSKIELGDDVIAEIKRLQDIIGLPMY